MEANQELDSILKQRISHLQNYPFFLPYVGRNYHNAIPKLIIVGESHYLPKDLNGKITAEMWYSYDGSIPDLIKEHHGWLNNRRVLNYYPSDKTHKAYRIFLNLEQAYKTRFKDSNLFDECVYLNYFQRPAETKGGSINANTKDNEVAYENIKAVIDVLSPDKVVFVSSKAYNSFIKLNKSQIPAEIIEFVPHPACAWWNRNSKRYKFDDKDSNGRSKFIRLISKEYSFNHNY